MMDPKFSGSAATKLCCCKSSALGNVQCKWPFGLAQSKEGIPERIEELDLSENGLGKRAIFHPSSQDQKLASEMHAQAG
jgi:hypothetical protein